MAKSCNGSNKIASLDLKQPKTKRIKSEAVMFGESTIWKILCKYEKVLEKMENAPFVSDMCNYRAEYFIYNLIVT